MSDDQAYPLKHFCFEFNIFVRNCLQLPDAKNLFVQFLPLIYFPLCQFQLHLIIRTRLDIYAFFRNKSFMLDEMPLEIPFKIVITFILCYSGILEILCYCKE